LFYQIALSFATTFWFVTVFAKVFNNIFLVENKINEWHNGNCKVAAYDKQKQN